MNTTNTTNTTSDNSCFVGGRSRLPEVKVILGVLAAQHLDVELMESGPGVIEDNDTAAATGRVH